MSNINEIENRISELTKRKNALEKEMKYKEKKDERKVRARRLIETGALAEKYFEIDNLSIEEREELFKMFSSFVLSNKPKKFKN
ncbi:hypothetical protein [Bacillus amyloliquefaciens]|uniref:hypothetical protein n=1 Tax=Bacillus amyloliquefaciens TaxID=1390 RepID=UPI002FF462ED